MDSETTTAMATLAKQLTEIEMTLATRTIVDACKTWRAVVDAGEDLVAVRAVGDTLARNDHSLPPVLVTEISEAADVLTARHWAASAVVGLAENMVDAWMKVQAVALEDADTISAVVERHILKTDDQA